MDIDGWFMLDNQEFQERIRENGDRIRWSIFHR